MFEVFSNNLVSVVIIMQLLILLKIYVDLETKLLDKAENLEDNRLLKNLVEGFNILVRQVVVLSVSVVLIVISFKGDGEKGKWFFVILEGIFLFVLIFLGSKIINTIGVLIKISREKRKNNQD